MASRKVKEGGERVYQRPTNEAEFGVATVYDFKQEWDGAGNRTSAGSGFKAS